MREATKANLASAGCGAVEDGGLIMRSKENCNTKLDTVVAFKGPARGEIEKQGYKIIANVGDQSSDLNGGFSGQNFNVPNPFYFIK